MRKKDHNRRAILNERVAQLYSTDKIAKPTETNDLFWLQWGKQIVDEYPRDKWAERIDRIPEFYQDYIRSRIIREYGDVAE